MRGEGIQLGHSRLPPMWHKYVTGWVSLPIIKKKSREHQICSFHQEVHALKVPKAYRHDYSDGDSNSNSDSNSDVTGDGDNSNGNGDIDSDDSKSNRGLGTIGSLVPFAAAHPER